MYFSFLLFKGIILESIKFRHSYLIPDKFSSLSLAPIQKGTYEALLLSVFQNYQVFNFAPLKFEVVTLFWEDDNGHLVLLRIGFVVANFVSYHIQLVLINTNLNGTQ